MSQEFMQQLSASKELPTLFEEIAAQFVPKTKMERYREFIKAKIAEDPSMFTSDKFQKECKRKQRELAKRRREEKLPIRKMEFSQKLKKHIQERHTFVDSLQAFTERTNGMNVEQCCEKLQDLIQREKTATNTLILCKIFIGKFAGYLQNLAKDKATFYSMLKVNNILYSRTEIFFCVKLSKLAAQFPRISLLNIPIRVLKNNLSILENVLEEEKEFWTDINL